MIYDTLENINKYLGLHPNLDTALHFLKTTNFNEIPLGITEIDGEKIYLNMMEADLKKKAPLSFEYHENYADIQFDLVGEEAIAIGIIEKENTSIYNNQTDFGTVECEQEILIPLGKDRFIICFTNEPHQPGIGSLNHHFVKKGVIKVFMKP